MTSPSHDHAPPYWSLGGLGHGALLAAPALPGIVVFAAAFGTLAAERGLTLLEATAMSAIVFGGASQLAAMEVWENPLTPAVIVALALVVGAVNMRLLLISASMRPWLGSLPSWQTYPALYFLTDAGWLMATRYRAEGGADVSVFVGASLALWATWVASTVPGYLLGELIADPRRVGLDMVMPAVFVAMLVPLWRGPRRAIPWVVAGAVALVVASLTPGWWFVIAGAVAGCIAGGFVDEPA
ncbi:MAG TPA: AzlC family ABC transporter permease [Xanthobacteraceae bacterium]|nr:AzlC family ABC transporter permease [Xanthobacteraceae bacterium]